MPRPISLTQKDIDRFWSHVDKSGNCWLWTGALNKDRYGRFQLHGAIYNASRVAWTIACGPIPPQYDVCHSCDNPTCVCPEHLFLGTPKDNARDMVLKGRQRGPKGDTHPFRLHPELHPHGDTHPMHLHPERLPRGEKQWCAKLTEDQVRQIRDMNDKGYFRVYIAKVFHVSRSAISAIVNRKTWKHIG